jgi:SAM-dependent methyltransferase
LGCARGELSLELAKSQKHLVAMDMEFQPCWRQKPGIDFVQANALQLPFRNSAFDVLVVSECLQYIADVKSALNEFYRVLKPSGQLILSFPDGHYYLYFFDPYNIIRLLKKITRNPEFRLTVGYHDLVVYPSCQAILAESQADWELKKIYRRGSVLFIYYALIIDVLDFLRQKAVSSRYASVKQSILSRAIRIFFKAMQLDFCLPLGSFSYNCILLLKKPAKSL